jgi:hypothetical protein
MLHHTSSRKRMPRIGRYFGIGLFAVCLGLPGCTTWNMRGDGFNDDSSRVLRQCRPADNDVRFWGFTNKAREIEQDFGAR